MVCVSSRRAPGFYFTLCLFSTTNYNLSHIIVLFQVSGIFAAIRHLNPKFISIAQEYFATESILSDSFFFTENRMSDSEISVIL